ncbi:hypothetical protein HAX54_052122 [Datura stramonium]|uniref:Uncharacterized protein n=1 Tax=Datura stramonium TaxID=4076 RepID=A0ABS8RRL0_DATST|nr:hypothetical protein [Datura stramonium]
MFLSGGQSEVEATLSRYHEPRSQPMARVVLICQSPSEHMPQDLERKTRKCEGSSGCLACQNKGQLLPS